MHQPDPRAVVQIIGFVPTLRGASIADVRCRLTAARGQSSDCRREAASRENSPEQALAADAERLLTGLLDWWNDGALAAGWLSGPGGISQADVLFPQVAVDGCADGENRRELA
jgi:hypothetical protein